MDGVEALRPLAASLGADTETTISLPSRWVFPPPADPALTTELMRTLEVPQVVAELLIVRGVGSPDEGRRFLSPSMDHLLPTASMRGMSIAVGRLRAAINAGEPILIYGDYDVDGTTAVVLLKTAIEMLGGVARFHVPHRLREGYGMQREVLERARLDGVRLVVSVDTGIRAFAAAEAAEALGLDQIVTDHHLPDSGGLPRALAVLNPNQPGCDYGSKALCGAGVAFKLAQALLEADADAAPEPAEQARRRERLHTRLLPSFLKLLAIATVADAVPLLGENRAIVALGLEALRRPASPGLRALMRVARLDPEVRPLKAIDIGFRLGPRINAAGRMDVASDVIELFTTRHPARALELAEKLEQLNSERRQTELAILTSVMDRLREPEFAAARCIVLDGEDWHRGVIGILASRVVDATGKPAVVIGHVAGEAYGSGRSVEGFHLLEALEQCAELFTRFGGHAHAVGFSLPSERVGALRSALVAHAAERLGGEPLARTLLCDAELPLDRITPALSRQLALLEPTGMRNQEPVFVTNGVTLTAEPRYIKEQHVKLDLRQGAAGYRAIGWRWGERVRAMELRPGAQLAIAYKLRENQHPEYGGLELELLDILPAPRGQGGAPARLSPT